MCDKMARVPVTVIPKAAKVHDGFRPNPLRLKSGAIGRLQLHDWGQVLFSRSDDGGKRGRRRFGLTRESRVSMGYTSMMRVRPLSPAAAAL